MGLFLVTLNSNCRQCGGTGKTLRAYRDPFKRAKPLYTAATICECVTFISAESLTKERPVKVEPV